MNHQVSLLEASKFWFKLGCISFGGPAGQIATVHQELVENKRWISEKRFLHALNFCMLLPGPEALQLVIYIGWLMHKRIGGLIAGLLFILPALCLLIALSWLYINFGNTYLLSGIFFGLKPAVTAIVIAAAIRIGKRILRHQDHWIIAALTFIAISVFNVPFPALILIAALLGIYLAKKNPEFIVQASHNASANASHAPAIIDDHSPIPEHARFHLLGLIKTAILSKLAWAIPFFLCVWIWGKNGLFTNLAWFFTKAALLTFGGAYAVLPYVYQSAVDHFHWLSATQMIDGLALGETTPGPLILVVAFVGYLASQGSMLIGDNAFLSGAFGAFLVSWFIFLPSFCFIFIGGPLIESTHQESKFSAPLTGITSAVVGVISSLALFFAIHTFFPMGIGTNALGHCIASVLICALAGIGLIKYQRSILEVLFACGILGLIAYSILHLF